MNRARIIFILITLLAPATFCAQQSDLAIKETIQLTSALDGINGHLELLEDARLTPELDKLLWDTGGPDMALDTKDPRYKELTSPPLHPAVLRLLDSRSKTVAERNLEREQARIRTESLHPGHRTILVTTDLSAGFGSYSGPFTDLLEVGGGTLEPVNARNAQSGKLEPIHLASTLKTAWKFAPSAGKRVTSKDILELACRPNNDASVFYISYIRYHWNGEEWVEFSRRSRGMWESDEAFPPPARFPDGPR